ncbi:ABC transporter ATP-binding protein [Paraburkholderia sediminicola]|uniref:ABC transporter ATP-binding protein n=1 Tax=Paraburkholderia sediminicola TaxID=458836 RepID=UPI0038B82473
MLEVENLCIAFETKQGLRPTVKNMSLSVRPGEIVGLVGESGSGKTLMSLGIMGLLPPNAKVTDGAIRIGGTDLLALDAESLRKMRGSCISMVFQDPLSSLDPVFPCGDQIVDAIRLHEDVSHAEAYRRGVELLRKERIADPVRCMKSYPHELSGGQCQRVMIAMAVACRPQIIIADEPTTALDVTVQKQVLEILRDLNREVGAAILLITHDLGVIYEVADRVVVMYRGVKMEEATTAELFAAPKSDYTRALIAAMPSLGDRRDRLPTVETAFDAVDGEETGSMAAHPDARPLLHAVPAEPAPPRRADTRSPLLSVRHLCKTYVVRDGMFSPSRAFRAVDDVSFDIPFRTTMGLVGESGCGKSTLSRLIMRLIASDSGSIVFNGQDLAGLCGPALRQARRDMAMVFQDPYGSLNPRQTVEELIAEPLVVNGRGSERARVVARMIDCVGLPRSALGRYPHEFSGGQRQRIAIARALALHPALVICDEAVSALDVSVQAQVLNLLKDLQREFDLTYLFISHDLSVVEHVSDTIAVMQGGRIVETGPADAIFAAPAHDYTKMLLGAVPRAVRPAPFTQAFQS